MTTLRKRNLTSPNEFTGDFDGHINLVNEQYQDYFRLRAAENQTVADGIDYVNKERGAVGMCLWPLSLANPFDMTVKNTTTPNNALVPDSGHIAIAPLNKNPVDENNGTALSSTVSPSTEIPNLNMYSNMYAKARVENTKFTFKLSSAEPIPLLVGYSVLPRYVQMVGGTVVTPADHAGVKANTWYPLGKGTDSLPEQPLTYVLGKMPAATMHNGAARRADDISMKTASRTFSFNVNAIAILKKIAQHTHPHADVDLDAYTAAYGSGANPSDANDLLVYLWVAPLNANLANYEGTQSNADDEISGIMVEMWNLNTGGSNCHPWTSRIWVSMAAEQTVRLLNAKRPLDILTTIPDVTIA